MLSWVPLLVVLSVLVVLFALLGVALVRLRHHKARSRAHAQAALAIARAIKSAENRPWADELRNHIKVATCETEGGEELRRLLRQHAELRLTPRRSEGAALSVRQ